VIAVRGDETTVYVGNLPWLTTEDDLAALLAPFGPVGDVRVVISSASGRSLGYGFVELPGVQQVREAVASLNGRAYRGRVLIVSLARPRPKRD